jgi:hypothetical protein
MNRSSVSIAQALPRQAASAALLAALVAAPAAFAQGLDSIGSAFRPQAAAPSSAAGNAAAPSRPAGAASAASAKDTDGTAGLRVVVTSGSRSLASIDGRIVRVGDSVNGMRVTQIGPQGVVLRGEAGAKEHMTLNPAAVKKPANSTRVSTGARP